MFLSDCLIILIMLYALYITERNVLGKQMEYQLVTSLCQ